MRHLIYNLGGLATNMDNQEIELYDRFITAYNEIDEHMRKILKSEDFADHMTLISLMSQKDSFFAQYGRDLKNLAKLRNVLEHNPYRKEAHPMAAPNPEIVKRYENLRNLLIKPPLALSISIPGSLVYTTTLDALATEVMAVMDKNTYTQVPVLENGRMIGTFSENVILSYLADSREGIITRDTKIEEFKKLIPFDKHHSEVFEFVPKSAPLSDIFKLFKKAIKKRDRIGMVFITQNGKPEEKFIAILTAWDLVNSDEVLL